MFYNSDIFNFLLQFLMCTCLENGLQMCIFGCCHVDYDCVLIDVVLGQSLVVHVAVYTRLCKHLLDV